MVVGCNYDCNVSSHEFGGTTCGLSINGCSLQPDNWRLLTCNRRLRFISPIVGFAMATFFLNSPSASDPLAWSHRLFHFSPSS